MLYERMYNAIAGRGYTPIRTNKQQMVGAYRITEDNSAKIIVFIEDASKSDMLQNIKDFNTRIQQRFIFVDGCRSCDIINIIITDTPEVYSDYVKTELKVWIYDTYKYGLMIFENEPDDFDGLRELIINHNSYSAQYAQANNNNYNRQYTQANNNNYYGQYVQNNYNQYYGQHMVAREGFSERFKQIPLVTIILVLVNVIVHFILASNGDTENVYYMHDKGALFWRSVFEDGEYYRLFTAMFMHFGIEHLINNMASLAIIGSTVEVGAGKLSILITYFIAGLFGNFMSAAINAGEEAVIVSAGASGAIFGLLGAMLVIIFIDRHKKQNQGLYARMLILIVLQVFNAFTNTGVDNIAHFAGMFAGIVIMSIILNIRKLRS